MKLYKLSKKFQSSGIGDNPPISDKELQELLEKFSELAEFLYETKNTILGSYFSQEVERIKRMQEARKE